MSTRRTTRATSKASSRAVSPAPSTATPRRTRRAGNEALPAVGLRQSTAYGHNTTAKPSRVSGPVVSDQINTVLNAIINTPHPNTTTRPASPTPVTDKSFGIESGLFYGAHVESSPASIPTPTRKSPEPPTTVSGVPSKHAAEIKAIEDLARTRLDKASNVGPTRKFFKNTTGSIWSFFTHFLALLWSSITALLSPGILKYCAICVIAFAAYHFYSSGRLPEIGPVISRVFPFNPRNPFEPDDLRVVNKRISDLEYDVARLKSSSDLDSRALTRLDELLPDLLVVKKDKYQNMIIPDDFWYALQEKIRSDDTLVSDRLETPGNIGSTISNKEFTKEVEKVAKASWDRYIKQNANYVKGIVGDEITDKFPRLAQEHQLATKEEVIELLRRSWDENSSNLQTELAQLSKKIAHATRSITKLQNNPGSLTKEEVQSIIADTLKKLIPNGQLGSLADANIRNALEESLARPNFFSKATGAVVDPVLTSSTYVFPGSDVWFPSRWMRAIIGNPITPPNPPEAALTRWEEFGDCWCSSSVDAEGYGPSIGVITGSSIYPEQVVVEHIPAKSTLEPGATPKDMELLAYIPDLDTYNAAKTLSEEFFADDIPETQAPYRFVHIASWTYEKDAESVQAFQIQVDMTSIGAEVNKFIVRAKNNWGGEKVPYTCLYRIRVHGETIPNSGDV
ncbi:uncharacterized protein LY89DRAFT_76663 [Mollisia scopiformis]|uniref:SUN domain-containing protein n=1 Tax=Mollisia scopiformis TaxID=149040 RepID=A0A194X7W0_MOLSC|nr:uncharacterized protein LY89DRAFT_76663 [Mollisia scopiformis]KUJ16189.1 hypothetical protein LY89DRAFT_76663 [Mollisia scopiformis]